MLPGSHFTRTTYGPGLPGSPKSTADSFVPAAFLTHLISAGILKSTAARSMSLSPRLRGTPRIRARAAAVRAIVRVRIMRSPHGVEGSLCTPKSRPERFHHPDARRADESVRGRLHDRQAASRHTAIEPDGGHPRDLHAAG